MFCIKLYRWLQPSSAIKCWRRSWFRLYQCQLHRGEISFPSEQCPITLCWFLNPACWTTPIQWTPGPPSLSLHWWSLRICFSLCRGSRSRRSTLQPKVRLCDAFNVGTGRCVWCLLLDHVVRLLWSCGACCASAVELFVVCVLWDCVLNVYCTVDMFVWHVCVQGPRKRPWWISGEWSGSRSPPSSSWWHDVRKGTG